MSRTARWATTIVAVLGLILGTAVPATAAATPVGAAVNGPAKMSLAGFNPGNIISDAVFTDRSTMTEAQIQTFFNSKVKTCRAGYTCLKDYRTTSVTRPADKYCRGYAGAANESAARIIYRVAQACDINPQVLIVMLQKEQGLINHTWPSQWRYDAALGQACPDTAPCDPKFVGFFHQIYGAARQMQIYMEGRYFQWYKAGQTWQIQWHPDRARCGTGPVYIANKATEALYYYTPYQPNAAAMRAGYGTGDSCSSYGNRNFYNYFTDWFGSTQKPANSATTEIKSLYSHLGGTTGVLGEQKTAPSCTSTTARCTWSFANGIITWTSGLGALTVYGDVYDEYVRQGGLGGKLGYPAVTPKAVTDPNGDGIAQEFSNGWIHLSDEGAFASTATVMAAYSDAGWLRGDLGWPTGPEKCTTKSCVQDFAGGMIGYLKGQPAFAVTGAGSAAVDALHAAQGGAAGPLGRPAADLQVVMDASGNGLAQKYENGWIHSSARGTFSSSSKLMTAYSAAGWLRGDIGWPTAAEQKVTDPNGNGLAQAFAGGWIHVSDKGGFASSSAVMKAYSDAGWIRGSLGWPRSGETCTSGACTQLFNGGIITHNRGQNPAAQVGVTVQAIDKVHTAKSAVLGSALQAVQVVADPGGGGLARKYEGGWVHSSASGTFASSNAVMTAYSSAGWIRGSLGWPTSDETCSGTYCSQRFSGGVIAYTKGKAAVVLVRVEPDAIARAHKAAGGNTGMLGAPVAPVQVVTDKNGNGLAQKFARGWIHASKSGTFVSSTTVMTAYSTAKWLRGPLAWPTSAETCVGDYCAQSFTGGSIAYTKGKAAVPLVGVRSDAISTTHAAEGGDSGHLGAAGAAIQIVSDENGNGLAQKFAGGWVHASENGTFSSSTTIMTAYSAAGWLRGRLGWPTGEETCTPTLCSQQFTGGTISYKPDSPAVTTYR